MNRAVVLILALPLTLFQPLAGQDETEAPVEVQSPTRDPQAVLILEQTFLAMGGSQKASILDSSVEGTISAADAPDVPVSRFSVKQRAADFRVDIERGGETESYRVLAGHGSFRSSGKTRSLPRYNTAGLSPNLLPILSNWVKFLDARSSARYLGVTMLDGLECHIIRVESKGESTNVMTTQEVDTDVLVSVHTGLLVGIRYRATLGPYTSDKVEIEHRFAEYRDYGGLLVPTKVVRYLRGKPVQVLTITNVTFNNGLSDVDFQN